MTETFFYRIKPCIIWTLLDGNWADIGVVDPDAEFSWDQVVFDNNSDIEMVV